MQETIWKPQEDKLFQLAKRKQDPRFELAAGRTWHRLSRVALKRALGWWKGTTAGVGDVHRKRNPPCGWMPVQVLAMRTGGRGKVGWGAVQGDDPEIPTWCLRQQGVATGFQVGKQQEAWRAVKWRMAKVIFNLKIVNMEPSKDLSSWSKIGGVDTDQGKMSIRWP